MESHFKGVTGLICRVHAKVEGREDARLKLVIDDGTGAVLVVLDAYATKAFSGYGVEEFKAMGSHDAQIQRLEAELVGKKIEVKGEVLSDDFGYILLGREIVLRQHLFGLRLPFGPDGQEEWTHAPACPCYRGKPPFVESPAVRYEMRDEVVA